MGSVVGPCQGVPETSHTLPSPQTPKSWRRHRLYITLLQIHIAQILLSFYCMELVKLQQEFCENENNGFVESQCNAKTLVYRIVEAIQRMAAKANSHATVSAVKVPKNVRPEDCHC